MVAYGCEKHYNYIDCAAQPSSLLFADFRLEVCLFDVGSLLLNVQVIALIVFTVIWFRVICIIILSLVFGILILHMFMGFY